MKAPVQRFKHKDRPAKRDDNVSDADIMLWKSKARYTGSPEHKRAPWNGVTVKPRPHASLCSPNIAQDLPQKMLEAAIAAGNVSVLRVDEWPRYVWYLDHEGQCYTARLTLTGGDGAEYKGWPEENERAIPPGVKLCTL